jgi:tetratricopeptide (TPR) repeat protein
MLTPLTWARNADWASDILLDEAEYRTGNRAVHVIKALVLDHSMVGNHSRSVEICDRHFDALKEDWILSDGCGTAYSHVGRIDAAEQVFSLALDIEGAPSAVHDSMGDMYLRLGRRRDAENYYLLSIDEEERPFLKEYKKANMLIQLNQSDRASLLEARAHLEQVLVLQPQFFRARTTLNKLNAILGY